jgi:hypothetical protein
VLKISSYRLLGLAAMAALLTWGMLSDPADSAPQPNIVPMSWELDFTYEHPRLIWVKLPTNNKPTAYWYMTYMLTNNTGRDQNWVPKIEIYTSQGDLIPAGKGVSPQVVTAIQKEQKNPLLKTPISVVGKLRQGEDQAIESIIVWPAGKKDVDQVTIFVGGLSGETQIVRTPDTDQVVRLRKTRMLQYTMPGTPANIVVKPVGQLLDQWIMR